MNVPSASNHDACKSLSNISLKALYLTIVTGKENWNALGEKKNRDLYEITFIYFSKKGQVQRSADDTDCRRKGRI